MDKGGGKERKWNELLYRCTLANASVTVTSWDNGRSRRGEQFSSLTSAGHEGENKNRRKKRGRQREYEEKKSALEGEETRR